jgi:hypothetical protein
MKTVIIERDLENEEKQEKKILIPSFPTAQR